MNPKAELILHPIRMRIITELSGIAMTAGELAAAMPDVAQATLYRHLNKLLEGEVLHVVEENQVRGTLEKVYGLAEEQARITEEEVAQMGRDELMHIIMTTSYGVIAEFQRYLDSGEANLHKDRAYMGKQALYLSEADAQAFMEAFTALVKQYEGQQPAPDRRQYFLSLFAIPGKRFKDSEAANTDTKPEGDDA